MFIRYKTGPSAGVAVSVVAPWSVYPTVRLGLSKHEDSVERFQTSGQGLNVLGIVPLLLACRQEINEAVTSLRKSLDDVSKDAQAAVASLGFAEGTVEQVTSLRALCQVCLDISLMASTSNERRLQAFHVYLLFHLYR